MYLTIRTYSDWRLRAPQRQQRRLVRYPPVLSQRNPWMYKVWNPKALIGNKVRNPAPPSISGLARNRLRLAPARCFRLL